MAQTTRLARTPGHDDPQAERSGRGVHVAPADRLRLLDVISHLKEPGRRVAPRQVAEAWRAGVAARPATAANMPVARPPRPVVMRLSGEATPLGDQPGVWFRAPDLDWSEWNRITDVLFRLEPDDRYFLVALEKANSENDQISWGTSALTPVDLADALADLRRAGTWDGRRLYLASCRIGQYGEDSFAGRTLLALYTRHRIAAAADAAEGTMDGAGGERRRDAGPPDTRAHRGLTADRLQQRR